MAMTDHPASADTSVGAKPDGGSSGKLAWVECAAGPWRWRIRADWVAAFESCDAPDWLDLEHDPRARLVKTNDLRDVFRVEMDEAPVFAKISRPLTRWDRLRHRVLGPDCLREWRVAEYARQQGIQTVVPVAVAWAPIEGREPASILVTLETPDAAQLDTWWQTSGPRAGLSRTETNRIIEATAEFIARAHHGCFIHTDLHAGNILVRRMPDGRFDFCFVDLQAVLAGLRVGVGRTILNLARFGHWFRDNASVADRIRFLRRCLAWRERLMEPHPCCLPGWREFVPHVDRAMRRHARSLAAQRDRQALRNGRRFGLIPIDSRTKAHVFLWSRNAAPGSALPRTPLTRQWWRKLLASEMDSGSWVMYNITHRKSGEYLRSWGDRKLEDGKPVAMVALRRRPVLGQQLKYLLFSSPEMHLWKTGNALLNRGIPAARPLAVCERRCCGLLGYALVLIENPRGAAPPFDFIDAQINELPPGKRYRVMVSIAHQIAMLFRKLDEEGFVYRKLRSSDLAICGRLASEESPVVVLIGYDGLRRSRRRVPQANLPALVQLGESLRACPGISRTDRLRVLKHYLNRIGRPVADWKCVWREMTANR